MPTKILVLESPSFQLGANAGETTERLNPAQFPERLKKHLAENPNDPLFVLAPYEARLQNGFAEATNGPGTVTIAYCASQADAIRFLPSLMIFAGEERAQGVKDCLQDGSTIYSDAFFNGKAVGSRLDPCFAFARRHLSAELATQAWGCLQSLVFLGLQNLPGQGEKGSGEKVDVQIGADDKFVAFTVRFDVAPAQLAFVRANPILALPRSAAGMFESRYIESAKKIEFNCFFHRQAGAERTIEITSFHRDAALEDASFVKEYSFKPFAAMSEGMPEETRKVKGGGFKKKFSEQVTVKGSAPEAEATTVVAGAAPPPEQKVVVSGQAGLGGGGEQTTVVKSDRGAALRIAELEAQVKALESNIKTREEALAKAGKEDPLAKRDVLTNIKDAQSEGLKQKITLLEQELNEGKEREKELMGMVDKAVQMKDEAAKRIKELDLKLKQASGGKGSKETMLERQLDEQKRQNKELSKKVSELMAQLKAA